MRRGLLLPSQTVGPVPIKTGLLAYWDAREIPSPGLGAGVASWPDGSGNGWHMAQATGAKQPLYYPSVINGRPGVVFDGVDDLLVVANQVSVSAAGTVLAVYQPKGGATHSLLNSCDEASTTRLLSFSVQPSGVAGIQQRNADTQDLVTGSLVTPPGKAAVLGVTASGAAWALHVNGISDPSLTVAGGTNSGQWLADTSARDNLTIGALKRTTEVTFANGAFGFVGLWDSALSAADMKTMARWLARIWKVPVS